MHSGITLLFFVALFGAIFVIERLLRAHKDPTQTSAFSTTYADGRRIRKLSTKEVLAFVALVSGVGGLCVWALIRYAA